MSTGRSVDNRRFKVVHFFLLGALAGALDGFPAAKADLRADDNATAMACFCGMPDFISLEMFLEMVF